MYPKNLTLDCSGNHTFFVAEVIGVESEGKVYLLYLCTSCGDSFCKDFKVATPGVPIRLIREEKQKGE
jgi:hypothetical protein